MNDLEVISSQGITTPPKVNDVRKTRKRERKANGYQG